MEKRALLGYEFPMSNYQTLVVSTDSRGVMTVSLNRPEVRNAFNEVMIDDFAHAFGVDALSKDVRAVVIKGEGPVFCAGGDLNWMKKAVDFDYSQNLADTRRLAQMFAVLNDCPKPVIGAVHGGVIGGGVGLVSICDIVIASAETQFSLSEVRLGVVPACIGPFVIAKIGASHARGLFMSADRFTAARAREIGLIHEVVEKPEGLTGAVERVLGNVLQCGPGAMAVAKRLVLDLSWPERRAQFPDCLEYVAKTLADLRVSAEAQEGVRAFLEKRKPSWLPKA
jgi:methylglutaconyl-CoA hydratase